MYLWLHMTVIKHGAGLPGCHIISTAFTGHDHLFTYPGDAVIAFAQGILVGMVNAVKMDGVGHVMGVFKGDPELVALFDPDHGRRQAQHFIRLDAFEINRGHPSLFRGEYPEPGLDAGGDGIGRDKLFHIRRMAVQLGYFQANMDIVGVAVIVDIIFLDNSIGGKLCTHQCGHRYVVRSHDEGGYFRGVIRLAQAGFLHPDSFEQLFCAPVPVYRRTDLFGLKRQGRLALWRRVISALAEYIEIILLQTRG